jgi:hypothetical protein
MHVQSIKQIGMHGRAPPRRQDKSDRCDNKMFVDVYKL